MAWLSGDSGEENVDFSHSRKHFNASHQKYLKTAFNNIFEPRSVSKLDLRVPIRHFCIAKGLIFRITVKSRNYESRNNELSRYNKVGHGDAVMQVSIEKSRYNELSRYNEVNSADGGPS